jgi:hypothetical protein
MLIAVIIGSELVEPDSFTSSRHGSFESNLDVPT